MSSPGSIVILFTLLGRLSALSCTGYVVPIPGSELVWKYCRTVLALQIEGVESDKC
ncbi:hypothetical protein PVAG01_01533 [Phlyctema vagabunda]|uniref:Uncharacterized protein n=1 Tax=Phlyctema vagabunda TaxID=108571 RepID=A0ABR4PXC7_9HELO